MKGKQFKIDATIKGQGFSGSIFISDERQTEIYEAMKEAVDDDAITTKAEMVEYAIKKANVDTTDYQEVFALGYHAAQIHHQA